MVPKMVSGGGGGGEQTIEESCFLVIHWYTNWLPSAKQIEITNKSTLSGRARAHTRETRQLPVALTGALRTCCLLPDLCEKVSSRNSVRLTWRKAALSVSFNASMQNWIRPVVFCSLLVQLDCCSCTIHCIQSRLNNMHMHETRGSRENKLKWMTSKKKNTERCPMLFELENSTLCRRYVWCLMVL